jgi:Outer membrane protein beta-barrel domain
MNKPVVLLAVLALAATPLAAQNWSLGAGVGPFVFGDFVRRTLLTGNEGGSGQQTTRLSAATRPGVAVDIERSLSNYFAIRLEGTFTRAPFAVKGSSSNGVSLDAGKINVGTFMTPIVFRLNPHGTFQFHVMGGPAYAVYNIARRTNATGTLSPFTGTRSRWGAAAGGGVSWNWSSRFALEGQIADITTTSPFKRTDFPSSGFSRTQIPRTRNVHTTLGVRVRF